MMLVLVAGTSALSGFVALTLARRGRRAQLGRVVVAGLMPLAIIFALLIAGHIVWLVAADPANSYGPLVLLIYGFWMIPIIVGSNLFVAFGVGRRG